jgi:ketosteroid isomerase-like protein
MSATCRRSNVSTRSVVEEYFRAVNSGRWDDYLDLFDDTVVMDEQLLGHLEGKAALAEGIEGLRSNLDFRNRPVEVVVEGDRAMASWHLTSPKADGTTLDVRGVNVFHVRDGRIQYFANFHDTAPFAASR